MELKVQAILQRFFSLRDTDVHKRHFEKLLCDYLIIPGKNGPRWLVPSNPKFSINVLPVWKPYSISSKIKWFLILMLYFLRLNYFLPIFKKIQSNSILLKHPNSDRGVVPVIYIGTPGKQQKAVATLVDYISLKPLAVMKVALQNDAFSSILKEAETLNKLSLISSLNVPKLIKIDYEGRQTWQTYLQGSLSGKRLLKRHIDWLLKLPKPSNKTTVAEYKQKLIFFLDSDDICITTGKKKKLWSIVNNINIDAYIPLTLVHGDFAPWNIKFHSNKELVVIDWEDAEFGGLPLWDLCHYFFIQEHLLGSINSIKNLFSNSLIDTYVDSFNVGELKKCLVMFYMLEMILDHDKNVTTDYKEFLYNKMLLVEKR